MNAPAKGMSPIRSLVQITVCGPMIPASDPAGHDPCDGAGFEALRGGIGRGEAVALDEGRVAAGR